MALLESLLERIGSQVQLSSPAGQFRRRMVQNSPASPAVLRAMLQNLGGQMQLSSTHGLALQRMVQDQIDGGGTEDSEGSNTLTAAHGEIGASPLRSFDGALSVS